MGKSDTSALRQRVAFVPLAFATFLLVSCDNNTITEYSIEKVDPMQSYGHEWLPLNPTTYRIESSTVVSETAGLLDKYENCVTMSAQNWECSYSDGSGSFGFRNGEFWRLPKRDGVKVVSSLEYNRIRCEWAYEDNIEGKFWGAVRCISGWE